MQGFVFTELEFSLNPYLETPLIIVLTSNLISVPIYNSDGSLASYNTSYVLPLAIEMEYCSVG